MTRIRAAFALVIALGVLAFAFVKVDTDVRGLLGDDERVTSALDTLEGRMLTLAIIDPDLDRRSVLASEIAAELSMHPMVHRVTTAPAVPSSELLGWIWAHRLVLAPPAPVDLTPNSLTAEMRVARESLLSSSDGVFADRYLRDPTGSFRRIVVKLREALGDTLRVYRGVPQARDDSAALVLIELKEEPFNVAAQVAFDAELTQQVRAGGADALLIGPRAISAEISNQIASRTTITAAVASALLLVWLVGILCPPSAILICLLPPAIGFGAAAIVVQFGFGSVHILALGFGGALLGLALDYPLHLLAGRAIPEQSSRARWYVSIGAATTAIAFLALLGSGIPAVGQIGLFVASGVGVAATSALWLVDGNRTTVLRSFTPVKRPLVVSGKLPVLAGLAVIGAIIFWQQPRQTPRSLVDLAPGAVEQIKRLDRMVGLPSGQFRIDVTGSTLDAVLTRQFRVAGVLQSATDEGLISRSEMLGSYLPARRAASDLPTPEALTELLSGPMAEAGLDAGFLGDITAAYRAALDIPPIGPDALGQLQSIAALAGLIRVEGDIIRAPVRLWSVSAPERLAGAIAEIGDSNVVFIDQGKSIGSSFEALTRRVSLWLAIGAVAGGLFLLAAVRRPAEVAEIALGCLVAGLLTALLAGISTGGVGVFHIVALTLVIGIGIDYGIFLTLSESNAQYENAMRSVLLCAATTLMAFLTMVFSGVSVLEEIGVTVSIGVVAMVGINLVRRKMALAVEEK